MPTIIIKNYQWRQTKERIIIYVPLKSRPKNVNLIAMDSYVKISFPPFILELFLWGNVLEEKSECTLSDTEVIFSLQKASTTSDWPHLEVEDISKEQKCDFRNQVLEKIRNISESYTKYRSEKRQHLQKEAIKAQINLDTVTLNKIESLRDTHRKTAMRDFEEWRSNREIPILQNISGKVQKNEKEYRPPLKWFKDDSNTRQSMQVDTKEEMEKETEMIEKQWKELLFIEEIKEKQIVEKNIEKKSITEKDLKEEPIIEREHKGEISIDKKLMKKEIVEENLRRDANFQEKANILEIKKIIITSSKSSNFEENSNFKESELDYKVTSDKSSMNSSLIKEINQKSLCDGFRTKIKKQRPSQNLIDRVLKNRYSKMNRSIFDETTKTIPLPRRSGTINITFSERVFPTPARESSHVEEQEWLSKQVEARRKIGFVAEELCHEEQDPQWLKDKGDDFFKAGNYLAAISAYTHGIKISDKMAALYVNRSAANYALGNYYRCIEDCSKALELMEPKCESNRILRAKCYVRRGAALCKLSAPQHGISELEAALKLDPNNQSIKCDLYTAKQYFNIKE